MVVEYRRSTRGIQDRGGLSKEITAMRIAAFSFGVYAFLIAISIVAVLRYNPSSSEPSFLVRLIFIFGGLLLWAASSAYALWNNRGFVRSFGFVAFLTAMVVMGAVRYGTFQPGGEIHPVLKALRTICGVSIVFLWLTLFRAMLVRSHGVTRGE